MFSKSIWNRIYGRFSRTEKAVETFNHYKEKS